MQCHDFYENCAKLKLIQLLDTVCWSCKNHFCSSPLLGFFPRIDSKFFYWSESHRCYQPKTRYQNIFKIRLDIIFQVGLRTSIKGWFSFLLKGANNNFLLHWLITRVMIIKDVLNDEFSSIRTENFFSLVSSFSYQTGCHSSRSNNFWSPAHGQWKKEKANWRSKKQN